MIALGIVLLIWYMRQMTKNNTEEEALEEGPQIGLDDLSLRATTGKTPPLNELEEIELQQALFPNLELKSDQVQKRES